MTTSVYHNENGHFNYMFFVSATPFETETDCRNVKIAHIRRTNGSYFFKPKKKNLKPYGPINSASKHANRETER